MRGGTRIDRLQLAPFYPDHAALPSRRWLLIWHLAAKRVLPTPGGTRIFVPTFFHFSGGSMLTCRAVGDPSSYVSFQGTADYARSPEGQSALDRLPGGRSRED